MYLLIFAVLAISWRASRATQAGLICTLCKHEPCDGGGGCERRNIPWLSVAEAPFAKDGIKARRALL